MSTRPIRQFDAVTLSRARPDLGLAKGASGVVVDVYKLPTLGYEVEFLDTQGRTLAVNAMEPEDVVLDEAHSPLRNNRLRMETVKVYDTVRILVHVPGLDLPIGTTAWVRAVHSAPKRGCDLEIDGELGDHLTDVWLPVDFLELEESFSPFKVRCVRRPPPPRDEVDPVSGRMRFFLHNANDVSVGRIYEVIRVQHREGAKAPSYLLEDDERDWVWYSSDDFEMLRE